MISRHDILRLLHRPADRPPVLSVFLDMSVDSDNKRTHRIFLDQRRAQYVELDSDRPNHHREPVGEAFARVYQWLDEQFDPVNKGVAVYAEIGGDWLEGFQFPVPVRNHTMIAEQPVVGPLAEITETHRRHGILVVDREHLRMFTTELGLPMHEHEVHTAPYPTPHDVKAGGEAGPGFQRRKAEEVRHFFKEFALEVTEFVRRYRPEDLIVLGTTENVRGFVDFLPDPIRAMIVHTDQAPIHANTAEILERIAPFLLEQRQRLETEAVRALRDRSRHAHLAVQGFAGTLRSLQEGRAESVILAQGWQRSGSRCTRCTFYLDSTDLTCPYCGGPVASGVDLVESVIRVAEEQDVRLYFVPPESMTDSDGVGALLRY